MAALSGEEERTPSEIVLCGHRPEDGEHPSIEATNAWLTIGDEEGVALAHALIAAHLANKDGDSLQVQFSGVVHGDEFKEEE